MRAAPEKDQRVTTSATDMPATYRINIAMAKLGVSRSTLYRLVNDGSLELIKISARASGITVESFTQYLQRQREAAAQVR